MSKTCGCGTCTYIKGIKIWHFDDCEMDILYCPKCGDKLLDDGTVESRAEVDKKVSMWDYFSENDMSPADIIYAWEKVSHKFDKQEAK